MDSNKNEQQLNQDFVDFHDMYVAEHLKCADLAERIEKLQ